MVVPFPLANVVPPCQLTRSRAPHPLAAGLRESASAATRAASVARQALRGSSGCRDLVGSRGASHPVGLAPIAASQPQARSCHDTRSGYAVWRELQRLMHAKSEALATPFHGLIAGVTHPHDPRMEPLVLRRRHGRARRPVGRARAGSSRPVVGPPEEPVNLSGLSREPEPWAGVSGVFRWVPSWDPASAGLAAFVGSGQPDSSNSVSRPSQGSLDNQHDC
jgi:hypothetical protein